MDKFFGKVTKGLVLGAGLLLATEKGFSQENNAPAVETPYFKKLKELKSKTPQIDPLNYLDKDTFVHDYIQQMDSFQSRPDGKNIIDFENAYYQDKKKSYLEEIEKYTKNPELFKGGSITEDDLFSNSLFNRRKYNETELGEYLERLKEWTDLINERRVYRPEEKDFFEEEAESLWNNKHKSL